MFNGGESKIVDFGSARQEETDEGEGIGERQGVPDAHTSCDWLWNLTPASAAVLETSHTLAKLLKHEANGKHLLAMVAIDEAGAGEIQKRGYDAEGAFRAAYSALMSETRMTHASTQARAGTAADLRALMTEAEVIAQGCEAVPRAVAMADIVAAILERPSEDAIRQLLMGRVPLTAAEEARDGVQAIGRLLNEELALLRDKLDQAQETSVAAGNRVGGVEASLAGNNEKLGVVEALATRTANDNDVRWTRTKRALLAMAALVVSASVLTAIDGGRSLRVVVAWLSGFVA